ncbi:serine hydrolase [uncultured Aquimarina sp.]|uniref:serine hydrolase domain-containing protein n=1 Tax=uncultured Aquimarina sp. TaxID=575652 RepID=UPI002634E85B|nr:serine hydrolase [uncultured Aquimarina sp.]
MNLKIYHVILVLFLFSSCKKKPANFNTEELNGVWSGLLFQTKTKYDSIVIRPAKSPENVILYQNGKANIFKLEKKDSLLTFTGDSGLRFDATFSNNTKSLYGVITDNLWTQSLQFLKSKNYWIAKIVKPEIIDTDYQVYLEFYKDSIDVIKAKIQSNKENRELHFKIDSVLINGNEINFNITNNRFGISAEFNAEDNNLLLSYGNTGGKRKVSMTKLNPSKMDGYKPLANQNYTYKTPDAIDSHIKTASLDDVGINKSMLALMPKMNSGKYDHIHSIIITKNNKLVFEEYFHGYDREYLHDIRSSFKSISSLLLGKSMMMDKNIQVNNPILNYYPEYNILDKDKNEITIHHSLTMSTGLKLEDEDEMQWDNNDWVGHKLNLPMKHEPGKKYQYSSGGMNLLTGVIQKSTEKYLPLFLYEEILIPMEIYKFQMRTSPQGRAYLPGDFYLRPIDFTKFGLLVLNKGVWNNQQIISSEWVSTSTQPYIKGSWPKNSDYGYLWRLLKRNVGGKQMKTIEAWGNGGQFLIIIPEIEMTITFTGGNYNLFPEMEEKPLSLLNEFILPAVELKSN